MGVYIPNMEKPKDSCWDCKAQYNSVCSLKREHIKWDGILDDCPLIEIDDTVWENEKYKLIRMTEEQRVNKELAEMVTCGECKHRDPENKKCDCGMFERQGCIFPVSDDYFCKYGERRADEHTD